MGGAGSARLGSTGALGTNPALLAWIPEEEAITSSNAIIHTRWRGERGDPDVKTAPFFLPVYAATTSRSGGVGRGFAFMSEDVRSDVSMRESESLELVGNFRQSSLSLAGALGWRWGEAGAGLQLGVSRHATETNYHYTGESQGVEYTGSSDASESFWTSQVKLGAAGPMGQAWTWGSSVKLPSLVWAAQGVTRTTYYDETSAKVVKTRQHGSPAVGRPVSVTAGVTRQLGPTTKMALDLAWASAFNEGGIRHRANAGVAAGMESGLTERLDGYVGVSFSEAESSRGGADDDTDHGKAGMGLSAGVKRRHKYATTLYGITHFRQFATVGEQTTAFVFGTRFLY